MIIFPLVFFFVLGYFFKVHFAYPEKAGQILTRIIFNVTMPATILLSISETRDISQAYSLPFVAFIIQVTLFGVFFLIAKKHKFDMTQESVFVTAPLITNTLFFLAPFIYLAYGDQGLIRIILYDIGNAVTVYFIALPLFLLSGNKKFSFLASAKAILSSVPLWSLIIGLIMAALELRIPAFLVESLMILKQANFFLPLFALGFFFAPVLKNLKLILFTVFARALLGLIFGVAISYFFQHSMDKIAVIMAASAPIGLMSLIFSAEYEKDTQFASGIISYSMIFGFLLCLALDYVFRTIGWISI